MDATISGWERCLGALVALDGLRLLGLTGVLTALGSGGLSFAGVLTLLSDLDSTVHDEGSLGNSASLVLLLGLGGGLGNLSLIGDGLLVWDNDALGSNLGSSASSLGDE